MSISLRDEGSIEGVQFTNISVETIFYERFWWGAAEPIHITRHAPRHQHHGAQPAPSYWPPSGRDAELDRVPKYAAERSHGSLHPLSGCPSFLQHAAPDLA